jgi:ornithine carbamoyltransferase
MKSIATLATARGGSVRVSDDIDGSIAGADAVYVKSWGSLERFGKPEEGA